MDKPLTRAQCRVLREAAKEKQGAPYRPRGDRGFHRVAWALKERGYVVLFQPFKYSPRGFKIPSDPPAGYVDGVIITFAGRAALKRGCG